MRNRFFKLTVIIFASTFFYFQPTTALLAESKNAAFLSPIDNIKLKLIKKFPEADLEKNGLILSQPWSISLDEAGTIYLLDAKEAKVFKITESSDKVLFFGKRGQGPGEFNFPLKIGLSRDKIWVFDPSARQIQFFDRNGKFIKMIKLFHRYNDVIVDQKYRLICTKNIKVNEEAKKIIDILDENGNIILSLGEPDKMDDIPVGLLNDFLLSVFKGKIIAASRSTGAIKVYDEQGELVEEIDLLKNYLKEAADINIKSFKKAVSPGKSRPYAHLFESIKSFNNAIYFLRSQPGKYEIIRIVENDSKFNIDKIYTYKTEGVLAIDFDIFQVPDLSLPLFYVINLGREESNLLKLTPEGGIK